jgi:NAD(P)-dependent dehydrogenase (short-subunit alcohol dehydrogenase family)
MTLDGHVALVTGGGRGLGRATALALAARGCAVVVADVLADETAETERLLLAAGAHGLGVVRDVSDETAVARLIKLVVDDFGQLDVLVNTVAWIDPPGLLVDMPHEIWEKTLRRPAGIGAPMQPEEVADVIVFLVSPEGSRINGRAISIG